MSHQQNTDDVLLKNAITTAKVTNTPIKDKNYSGWLTKMNEAGFHYFRGYSTTDSKDTPETSILGSPSNTSVSGKAKMTEAMVQETDEYEQCLEVLSETEINSEVSEPERQKPDDDVVNVPESKNVWKNRLRKSKK